MANTIWIAVGLVLGLACQAQCTVDCTSTGAGRFAEPTDTTCKQYTFCVYNLSTGTFLSYNYTCPTTSLFNPNTQACTTDYVCAVNSTTSNTTTTNTTTTLCTSDGYVADPISTNCSTYIECVDINGIFIATPYSCPNNTYFNPNTTLCETGYSCPAATFTCTAAGRFANTADSSCKTYHFCVLSTDGTFTQYEYTCPSTSLFSPISHVCTTTYTCSSLIPAEVAEERSSSKK